MSMLLGLDLDSFSDYIGPLIATSCFLLWLPVWQRTRRSIEDNIPSPPGGLPLLGHALAYKRDPSAFLQQSAAQVGGHVFRINLAGRRMIVVGSLPNDSIVTSSPEKILSSYDAIANVGFDVTLGKSSVFDGTTFHKQAIKSMMKMAGGQNDGSVVRTMSQQVDRAMELELQGLGTPDGNSTTVKIPDLFQFLRRCMMRVSLDALVGECILQNDDDGEEVPFLDEFIVFLDAVEDATAKAAVLPRFLAIPLILKPVQRKRLRLQKRVETRLQHKEQESARGPLLDALEGKPLAIQSELIVGLIFAAHKNPSIGAAQTLCMIHERKLEQQCRLESAKLASIGWNNLSANDLIQQADFVRRCVLETVRLTAHSIGSLRVAHQPITLLEDNKNVRLVPKGETVVRSHLLINLDPQHYGDTAKDFDPYRFTKDEVELLLFKDRPFATFSRGVHKCPGERLAIWMMQLMVAQLLSRDIQFSYDVPPKVSFERATLAQRDAPVPVAVMRIKTNTGG